MERSFLRSEAMVFRRLGVVDTCRDFLDTRVAGRIPSASVQACSVISFLPGSSGIDKRQRSSTQIHKRLVFLVIGSWGFCVQILA